MSSNIDQFLVQLDTMRLNTKRDIATVAKESAIDLADNIIERTPVDLDDEDIIHIKGDWTSAIDSVPSAVNRGDSSGDSSRKDIRDTVQRWNPMAGEELDIANHERYADMLEYGLYRHKTERTTASGFSSQAPAGMVGISVAEWQQIVDKNAAKK
jgi:hypothetical protein